MKVRKLVMASALILVAGGFGATSGLTHMRQTYNGACGKLTGVPGILQKMYFFAQGNCKVASDGTCQDAARCTISSASGSVSGKCSHKVKPCTCVAD